MQWDDTTIWQLLVLVEEVVILKNLLRHDTNKINLSQHMHWMIEVMLMIVMMIVMAMMIVMLVMIVLIMFMMLHNLLNLTLGGFYLCHS